ncbi:MAG: hypothetical protein JWO78_2491 [Micavibrio sp.]|nr:hypothetical protein [Micavibrio sp.]
MTLLSWQKPWAHDPQLKAAFHQYAMAYGACSLPKGRFLARHAESFYKKLKNNHLAPDRLMTALFLSVADQCNTEIGRRVPNQPPFAPEVRDVTRKLKQYPALEDVRGLRDAGYDVQVIALCELAVRTKTLRDSIENNGLHKGDVQTMQVYCNALDELGEVKDGLAQQVRTDIHVTSTALLQTNALMQRLKF